MQLLLPPAPVRFRVAALVCSLNQAHVEYVRGFLRQESQAQHAVLEMATMSNECSAVHDCIHMKGRRLDMVVSKRYQVGLHAYSVHI